MSAEWSVRPYREGDEAALVALFGRAFGKETSVARWRWKLAGPGGRVPNIFLAERGGLAICQYAGVPFRLRLERRELDAMLVVDAMTDPAWRRRGLLTQVGGLAHEAWRAAGVAFVLGLPNEQWGSRTEALSWRPLFPLEWRIRLLRPERTLARALGLPALARCSAPGAALHAHLRRRGQRPGATLRETLEPLDELDVLDDLDEGDDEAEGPEAHPVHDADFSRRRLLEALPEPYRLVRLEEGGALLGGAAFRVAGADAHLVDLRARARAIPALLAALADLLRAEGVEKVVTLAPPGSAVHRALRRAGYLRARRPFLLHAVLLDGALPYETLRDPRRWLLTPADFDVL